MSSTACTAVPAAVLTAMARTVTFWDRVVMPRAPKTKSMSKAGGWCSHLTDDTCLVEITRPAQSTLGARSRGARALPRDRSDCVPQPSFPVFQAARLASGLRTG
mmetsp:Transcript_16635/g.37286  ORF Transcript_16635/g.37286 Transcript_16635/m.37286 type:complete len:104 (-) Transcript_16635:535-846(-)